jgi:hypothetical protein
MPSEEIDALAFPENILDTHVVITRAALYIYINAMVSSRIARYTYAKIPVLWTANFR